MTRIWGVITGSPIYFSRCRQGQEGGKRPGHPCCGLDLLVGDELGCHGLHLLQEVLHTEQEHVVERGLNRISSKPHRFSPSLHCFGALLLHRLTPTLTLPCFSRRSWISRIQRNTLANKLQRKADAGEVHLDSSALLLLSPWRRSGGDDRGGGEAMGEGERARERTNPPSTCDSAVAFPSPVMVVATAMTTHAFFLTVTGLPIACYCRSSSPPPTSSLKRC
jgi:hypothetical protein